MRVCILTEFFYPDIAGSTPASMSELARYLADKKKIEIEVVTSRNYYRQSNEKLPPHDNWDGISIKRLATPRTNMRKGPARLAAGLYFATRTYFKLMASSRYDVVLCGTNPPVIAQAAEMYMKRRKVPYVYLIHDLYPDIAVAYGALKKDSKIYRTARNMQKNWLAGSASTIVLGRCMRDYLAEQYEMPASKIQIATNWYSPESDFVSKTDTHYRREHGLSGFLVVYAGNLGPLQGLDTVIGAARNLKSKAKDITFVFVGKGSREEEIANIIENERLDNVRLLPAVGADKYPEVVASADATVVSLSDGVKGLAVPSKYYSLLAAGRPVVGVLDLQSEVALSIKENSCGIVAGQNDPEGLAGEILKLSQDHKRALDMGKNARKACEEHYTLAASAETVYNALVDACGVS